MRKKLIIGLAVAVALLVSSHLWAEAASDETNAAVVYKNAGEMLTKMPADFVLKSQEIIKNGWTSDDEEMRGVLIANKDAINEFKRASKIKDCDFTKTNITIVNNVKEFEAKNLRYLSRLVLLEARLFEKENKLDQALDDYISVLTLANNLEKQKNPIVMIKLLELFTKDLAYAPISLYVNRKDLTLNDYGKLLSELLKVREERVGLEDTFKNEEEMINNKMIKDLKHFKTTENYVKEFSKEYYRVSNEQLRYLIDAYKENKYEKYKAKIKEFQKMVGIKNGKPGMLAPLKAEFFPKYAARILIAFTEKTYLEAFITHYYVINCKYDILTTAIAIKVYSKESGKTPGSLQEIVPKYLPEILIDPFDDFKPLKYKKTNMGWLVYSYGPDKTDDKANKIYDGSSKDKTGDIVFLSE